ncbi:MAG: hypothetical protein EOP89_07215 [Lysobacteraceae bacterium]|nr:MAG: hypothetical protein EOP89_07215 [Xanthomonadaceae bacterium]
MRSPSLPTAPQQRHASQTRPASYKAPPDAPLGVTTVLRRGCEASNQPVFYGKVQTLTVVNCDTVACPDYGTNAAASLPSEWFGLVFGVGHRYRRATPVHLNHP